MNIETSNIILYCKRWNDTVVFTGYHSGAGSNASSLAHTLREDYMYIKINGCYASEFLINAYTASYSLKQSSGLFQCFWEK